MDEGEKASRNSLVDLWDQLHMEEEKEDASHNRIRVLIGYGFRAAIAVVFAEVSYFAWIWMDSFKPASDENIVIAFSILACIVIPPFIAIGALIGHARYAALIGIACFAVFVAWVLFALTFLGGI